MHTTQRILRNVTEKPVTRILRFDFFSSSLLVSVCYNSLPCGCVHYGYLFQSLLNTDTDAFNFNG